MIEEIREHFASVYPAEGCGVIGIVKGKKKFFPCKNVAVEEDDFVMSSTDYLKLKKSVDIFAIVHNHPHSSNEPSEMDVNNCNALGLPYYIFSYPDMELNILQPKSVANELIGREYEFGVTDCFEASRDWLKAQGIVIPPRAPFEDDWWLKGIDYFTDELIKDWDLHRVDSPKPNDVLVFQVESDTPNHCGIYLGNDIFFHHAVNRLSCRESLYPFWATYLVGIYRHEA